MLSRDDCDPLRWQEERVLRPQLRGRLHDVCEAVAELRKKVGARQLVRGHQPAGAAPSGTRGRHTPVLAHQLASAREKRRSQPVPWERISTVGTDQGFGVSLEHEDGDTRGGRGRCWEMSAYTSAARHAAKCAESGRTRNVA